MINDMARAEGSSQIGKQEGLLYALLPMLIAVGAGAKSLPGVMSGGLLNPDSYMRLVRIEDGLSHHHSSYVVARDGSGEGTLLHWSHLLDMLLWLLATPFRLVMDTGTALHAAAVIFGPLCLGGLGVALAWAVAPVAERRWLWLATIVASLSATIVSYGEPGVVHHHVLLLVVAVMTAGYALRGALGVARAGAGLAMGAWGGVGIWLSPETMPFTLMAIGGLWLAWLLAPSPRGTRMIAGTAVGFIMVVTAAFAVDPPYAGYTSVEIDRISVVYLVLAVVVGMMAWCARLLGAPSCSHLASESLHVGGRAGPNDDDRFRRRVRMAVGIAVPLICLGIWISLFPAVSLGPGGLMNAHDVKVMTDGITEMMPVDGAKATVEYLLTGAMTAAALFGFGIARRSVLLGYAALCACVLVILGMLHVRFAAYPAVAAAAMLPIVIARCEVWFADWPESARAGARVSLIAGFVLLPCGIALPGVFSSAHAAASASAPTCSLVASTALLADRAGLVVLTDPSITPELLYRTQVLTVGSLYHRNVAAFMRARAAWRSAPSDTVPDAVRATEATVVLFCPSRARSLLVADLPPDTLMDRLNQGRVPPWLRPVSGDPRSGYALYEVMP
jgi:hypothetical protein